MPASRRLIATLDYLKRVARSVGASSAFVFRQT